MERLCVLKLMNKYQSLQHKPTKQLHILSAFTTDQNIGYIYVEAFREIHVARVNCFVCFLVASINVFVFIVPQCGLIS